MDINRETQRKRVTGQIRALEEQHRAALEVGDKTQAQAIYAHGQALCEGAIKAEQEAIEAIWQCATAKLTLFKLNLRGAKTRMARLNQQHKIDCADSDSRD